jgi:hypothetical protein
MRSSPTRFQKYQFLVPANLVFHAGAPVEINKIRATTEQHVLAVIDHFTGTWMLIRRRPAPEIRPTLKERDAGTSIRKSATHREAS